MTLHSRFSDAVRHLHPGASPTADFQLRAEEDGLHLMGWNLPGDPPTESEIEALLPALDRVSDEAVDAERDRRAVAGFAFNGALFQTRPQDRENIAAAAVLAMLALAAGRQAGDLRWHDGDGDFAWIAADNSLMPMDARTVIAFGKAAAARHRGHIFAARSIKNRLAAGEALAIADDALWPA